MEKKYVASRLFRNRDTDCQDHDEECQESDQDTSKKAWSHDAREKNETAQSSENQSIMSLPERILTVGKKLLARVLS